MLTPMAPPRDLTRLVRLLAALMISALPLSAATIFQDDFTYADGPLVTVSRDKWHLTDPETFTADVVSGQVSLVGGSNREDVHGELLGAPYTTNSGAILYATLTVNFTTAPSPTGTYFAHFRGDKNTHYCRIFATSADAPHGFFRFGIANYDDTPIVVPRTVRLALPIFISVRYDVSNAVSTLTVNSLSSNPAVATATNFAPPINITSFGLRQAPAMGNLFVDDLTVSKNSSFQVRMISLTDGMATLAWPAIPTRNYSIESSADFKNWLPISENLVTGGTNLSITAEAGASNGFFRIFSTP